MRTFLLLASCLSASLAWSQTPPDVLNRCQGEGCDCYAAYREGLPRSTPVPTIRPFTLHADLTPQSTVLGRFPAQTLALPLGEKTVVLQRGEYRVRKVHNPKTGLKERETLHTLLSEGEGFMSARRMDAGGSSQWVDFFIDDVELQTITKTRTQGWVAMKVGALKGFAPYAPDGPFEGCLE